MLFLVTLGERAVARHTLDLVAPEVQEWGWSGVAARRLAPTCGLLCFGSSMSDFSIMPGVLESRTSLRAANLSLCAGPPEAAYYLLRRALTAGARPKAVLLEIHPHSLSQIPAFTARFWPALLGLSESFELAWVGRDPQLFVSIALAKALPSYQNRERVREVIRRTLAGVDDPFRGLVLMVLRNKGLHRGAILQPRKSFDGGVQSSFREPLLPDSWVPSRPSAEYVRRFLDLASAHGIKVFWHVPPFCEAIRAERARKGLERVYTEYTRGLQARYRNLVVVDGLRAGYSDELFTDGVHMNRSGALAYSEAMARVVAAGLAAGGNGPRRVELPAYTAADDGSLEDVKQSWIAVTAPGRTVRR
jgi:hypothetical protein